MRYKLKKGKYGCYFYDSIIKIDLTLEMVLNKLNRTENELLKKTSKISTLRKQVDITTKKYFEIEKHMKSLIGK